MQALTWRRLGTTLLLLASLVAAPLVVQSFRGFAADAARAPLYADLASGDEIFVQGPAFTVFRDGYLGLRCRENFTGTCYGGTQILLDGWLLRSLPRGWLTAERVERARGTVPWPYLQTYPRVLQALRWSRVAYAALLLGAAAGAALYLTGDVALAWLSALALGSSPYFFLAWQGAKNDFPSALWEIFFALAALRAFRAARRPAFLAAVAVGTLCVFVRPVLLPMLLSFPLAFAVQRIRNGTRLASALADLALAGGLVGVLYAALHPNVFVSSLEANWIVALLHMGTHPASLADRLRELGAAIPAAWPWAVVLAVLYLRRDRRKQEWPVWLFFLLNAAFLYAVNVKTAHWRIQYYLPAFTLAFPLLAAFWPNDARARARFAGLLAACVFLSGLARLPSLAKPVPSYSAGPLAETLRFASGTWLVDQALQPPLRLDGPAEYFDSLAESPAEVRARFGAALPEKILVACWSATFPELTAEGYDSPVTRSWAALPCAERGPALAAHLVPFVSGLVPGHFAILGREEFLRTRFREFPREGTRIAPRQFRGFWRGMDNYGSPLLLRTTATLELDTRFARDVEQFRWPVASDCKDATSSAELRIRRGKEVLASKKIVLANLPLLCRDYPRLCRFAWFRKWSQRRFPAPEELALNATVRSGEPVHIELRADLHDCTLELQDLSFDPVHK